MRDKIFSILFIIPGILLLIVWSCKKPVTEKEEENLRISTDAVNNSEVLGTNYNFNLSIDSEMPPSGVRISVNVVGESDNRNYSPIPDIEAMSKVTAIQLHDLPAQVYCLCTIRVTSKTKASNTTTLSFRIILK